MRKGLEHVKTFKQTSAGRSMVFETVKYEIVKNGYHTKFQSFNASVRSMVSEKRSLISLKLTKFTPNLFLHVNHTALALLKVPPH